MAQGTKRRGRVFIYLALILILGLVLVWVLVSKGNTPLSMAQPTPEVAEEMVNIVVTTQEIHRGDVITDGVLTTIRYPKKDFVEGTFFTKTSDVVGKRAALDLTPPLPVTNSMLAEPIEGSSASFQIPAGMVAVSIPIDKLSSISYAPLPGDRVSVIASMLFVDIDQSFQSILPNDVENVMAPPDPNSGERGLTAQFAGTSQGRAEVEPGLNQTIYVVPSETQRNRLVSQMVLQDVIVLNVGTYSLDRLEGEKTEEEDLDAPAAADPNVPAPAPEMPKEITLIVTPQDAITLIYMVNSEAQLTLVLRSVADNQKVETNPVTLQYLIDQYNIPVPPKLNYGTEPNVRQLRLPVDDRINTDLEILTPSNP